MTVPRDKKKPKLKVIHQRVNLNFSITSSEELIGNFDFEKGDVVITSEIKNGLCTIFDREHLVVGATGMTPMTVQEIREWRNREDTCP